jgi:hypothetical protein
MHSKISTRERAKAEKVLLPLYAYKKPTPTPPVNRTDTAPTPHRHHTDTGKSQNIGKVTIFVI